MNSNKRLLKKYDNRKIYDPSTRTYLNLLQIYNLCREGEEITVIDHKTGKDITYITQLQALVHIEKLFSDAFDSGLLKNVFSSYEGTLSGYIKKLDSINV